MSPIIIYFLMFAAFSGMFILAAAIISILGRVPSKDDVYALADQRQPEMR